MEIYILPSVHILSTNPAHVKRAFEITRPDCIAVELCMARLASITSGRKPTIIDMFQNPILTSLFILQQSLGFIIGAKPGAEMIEAVKIANETKTPLLLADAPIEKTIKCVSKTSIWEKISIILPQTGHDHVDLSRLEGLTEPDALLGILGAFEKTAPNLYSCLISSRDEYIFKSVLMCGKQKVFLIIGAGHSTGIIKLINNHNINNQNRQISYRILDYSHLASK